MRAFVFFLAGLVGLASTALAGDALVVRSAQKNASITGYTRADTAVTVASEVSGRVLAVNYDVGDEVGRKPFVEIDPTFIDFKIQSTRLGLEQLDVALKKAEKLTAYLEKEYNRAAKLHEEGRFTEVKRDAAEHELAQARLDQDRLATERAALEVTLKELSEQRSRHDVAAPTGFVVIRRNVDPGEIISPGVPLGEAADFRSLAVPLCVSEQELSVIQAMEEPFAVTVAGAPAKARLNFVNPEFNEQTRKRCIELVLVDYPGKKMGGLSVALSVPVEAPGVMVPRDAILSRYENPRVTLADSGEVVPVMILGDTGDWIIVSADPRLAPGTRLASGGNQ